MFKLHSYDAMSTNPFRQWIITYSIITFHKYWHKITNVNECQDLTYENFFLCRRKWTMTMNKYIYNYRNVSTQIFVHVYDFYHITSEAVNVNASEAHESIPGFWGVHVAWYVCFMYRVLNIICLSFYPISFGHCMVYFL